MAITLQPYYEILPAYRPVKFETSITVNTTVWLTENAVVSIYRNATLLVTTRYKVARTQVAVFPNKTYFFEIDIQKYCQDSLAPYSDVSLSQVFAGSGAGLVDCDEHYADYYITVSYEGVNPTTGLLEAITIPLETSDTFTVVSSTTQHLEAPDLFYYYGTAGLQDGHCLTKSSRTIDICYDDFVYLSYLTPYNLASYGGIQVKLYDDAGNLLSEGIGSYPIPTLTHLVSTDTSPNSLKALTWDSGTPDFTDPDLSYYTVSFGLAFYIMPNWFYVRHTDLFTYVIGNSCCGSRSLRLHWLNLLGGVDSYTFNSEKEITLKSVSERGRKSLNWVIGSATPHDYSDSGGFKYNSQGSKTYTVRSRFLTNTEAEWLQDLLVSPKVFAQIEGVLVPVIVEDTEQSIYNPNGKIRYSLNVTLANDLIIQRV